MTSGSGGKPSGMAEAAHYEGHRDRLRERFALTGSEGLADYELLELVLFRTIPRRDVKPLAKALIARFGSLSQTLNAPQHLLAEVEGLGRSTQLDFRILTALQRRVMKEDIKARDLLSSWQALLDYCRAAMAHETREQFRILFLDKRNALIADEVQQTGTVDHTPVYPREIVRRALELSASALILVHNHPSGDVTPSRADIEMTRVIVETAKPLGIVVHDHLIIGRSGHTSFKGSRLL